MNITLPRLYWKEFRQLTPVLIAVVCIGLFLFFLRIFYGLQSNSMIAMTCDITVFFLPCMYAIGAAAVLISQEKETRSLTWLQSLPIPASQIVISKALVAVAGFIVICLFCWLLVLPWFFDTKLHSVNGVLLSGTFSQSLAYHFMAIYALIAALAAGWKTNSLPRAIFLFLVLVALPKVFEFLFLLPDFARFSDQHLSLEKTAFRLITITCSVGLAIAAYRWGLYSVGAHAAVADKKMFAKAETWSPGISIQFVSKNLLMSPRSALIWQTFRQFGGVAFLACTALLISLLASRQQYDAEPQPFPWREIWLFVWWAFLGTWVFHCDSVHRRVRFLSDRGIHGGLIWRYRIGIMAMAIVTTISLFYLLIGFNLDKFFGTEVNVFQLLALTIAAFGVAQWSGQISPSLILGIIQTPAILVLAMIYFAFAYHSIQAPLWILAVLAAIPYAVTRLTMQRWIDGRWDLHFWTTHLVGLICWLVLPLSALLYTFLSIPRMDRDVLAQLNAQKIPSRYLDDYKPTYLTIERFHDIAGRYQATAQWDILKKMIELSDSELSAYSPSATSSAYGNQAAIDIEMGNRIREVVTRHAKLHAPDAPNADEDQSEFRKLEKQLNDRAVDLSTIVGDQLASLDRKISETPHDLAMDWYVISHLNTLATLTSSLYHDPPKNENTERDIWKRHFNGTVSVFVRGIPELRKSPVLRLQDYADLAEIVLLIHLKSDGNLALVDQSLLSQCKSIFSDRGTRQSGRKFAVAASWIVCVSQQNYLQEYMEFGGYILGPFGTNRDAGTLKSRLVNKSRLDKITERLWRMTSLDAKASEQELVELAGQCELPRSEVLPPLRADDVEQFLLHNFKLPGTQWNAAWEDQAAAFANEELSK